MNARDMMTAHVLTVSPDTSIRDIASLLLERRISAVPVVDGDRRVVGIVSEGDLMRRAEAGTERPRSWWLDLVGGRTELARDFVKSHGRRAADVMTHRVFSVSEDTPAAEIVDLLESQQIKRVPVVRDGKLVGIVSRADLLRALLSRPIPSDSVPTDDKTLHDTIMGRLREASWASGIPFFNVAVNEGTVDLSGFVDSDEQRQAIRILAEGVPGAHAVHDHLQLMPRRVHWD